MGVFLRTGLAVACAVSVACGPVATLSGARRAAADAATQLSAETNVGIVVEHNLLADPSVADIAASELRDDLPVGAVENHGLLMLLEAHHPPHFFWRSFFGDVLLPDFGNRQQNTGPAVLFAQKLGLFQL